MCKQDVEGKHEHTHTIIRESRERTDSTMNHLQEKVTVIERVQFESRDEIRKEFEDLKEHTKKAEHDLEEQIRQVSHLYNLCAICYQSQYNESHLNLMFW